jgi:hypothetical protein
MSGQASIILKVKKGDDDFIGTFLPVGGKSGTSAEKSVSYAASGTWALAKAALPDSLPAYGIGYTR